MSASPSARTPVLLHIGALFHRAHQAWYLHRVNAAVPADERWSLTVGNIRDDMHATMDALAAQHGAYTLETVTPQGERAYETIRAITRVLPWSIDLAALIDAGADPACRIVSFRYRRRLLPRRTQPARPRERRSRGRPAGRAHDAGALAALLAERVKRGACSRCRAATTCATTARFRAGCANSSSARRYRPARMVRYERRDTERDGRPHHAAPDRRRARARAGGYRLRRRMPGDGRIVHPVGDRGPLHGRPAEVEVAGAELVDDVHPYEEAKIRILNATHSCIAWAGTLAGHTYIHEGTHDAAIRRFAYDYVTQDVIPCLTPAARSRALPRRRARTLRQPVRARHEPARRGRRLLEDSRLHRADARRIVRTRRGAGRHRRAARAVPALSAGRAARCRTRTGRRDGRKRRARDRPGRRPGRRAVREPAVARSPATPRCSRPCAADSCASTWLAAR